MNKEELNIAAITAVREHMMAIGGMKTRQLRPGYIGERYPLSGALRLDCGDTRRTAFIAARPDGMPKHVREAIFLLQSAIAYARQSKGSSPTDAMLPIVVSPYLSPASRAVCRQHGIAYLDFAGNARFVFDGIHIDRNSADVPKTETRALRSLFYPKSASVLFTMLRDPERAWRVIDLAQAASVSAGHVSNIRKALLAREWAEPGAKGIALSDPNAVLKEWRGQYKVPGLGKSMLGYTHRHGQDLANKLHGLLNVTPEHPRIILGDSSAADYLAPWVRDMVTFLYADPAGARLIQKELGVQPANEGRNFLIRTLETPTLFDDAVKPSEGILCTSPVATYLDLWQGTDRHQEAAEYLAKERLPWYTPDPIPKQPFHIASPAP